MDSLKNQKGLTILTTMLIVAAVLIIIASLWIISVRIGSGPEDNQLIVDENILLTHTSTKYARGEKTDAETGKKTPVFYELLSGEWREIVLDDGMIYCEKMDKYGFPTSFISDCILEYPKAKTAAEVIADAGLNGESVDIIGQISFGEDPSCSTCFKVSSGGGSLDLNLGISNGNLPYLNPGDTVVVTTEVVDGETTVISIENVDNNNDDNETVESLEDKDLREEIYYDITDLPPGVELGEEYYKWLYDIDNSDVEIQIIQDF